MANGRRRSIERGDSQIESQGFRSFCCKMRTGMEEAMKPYWRDRFPRLTRPGRAGRLRGPGATGLVLLLALALVGSMSPLLATADSAAPSADAARLAPPAPIAASAPA